MNSFQDNFISMMLAAMCFVIFVATFFRYTKIMAVPWAEELSRYLLIWITFIGAGVAAKDGSHFSVKVIVEHLPVKMRKIFIILQVGIMVIFCLFIAFYGFYIVKAQMMMEQKSPALQIFIWTMYIAIPIGSLSMMLQYVNYSIKLISALKTSSTGNQILGGGE